MTTFIGSSAAQPDLNWSQLRETILMLNLAIAQIDQSMNEGHSSVSVLSQSFTALATNLQDIQTAIQTLPNNKPQHVLPDKVRSIIEGSTNTAMDKVQASIVAFQFYDKLTQRLDHVSLSLSALAELIADPKSIYSPPKWQELQQSIRSKYTMEEERMMFDNVLTGMPVEQALSQFRQAMENKHADDEQDIEFF